MVYMYILLRISQFHLIFDRKWPNLMKRRLKDLSPLNFSFSQQWLDMMWARAQEVGTFLYL